MKTRFFTSTLSFAALALAATGLVGCDAAQSNDEIAELRSTVDAYAEGYSQSEPSQEVLACFQQAKECEREREECKDELIDCLPDDFERPTRGNFPNRGDRHDSGDRKDRPHLPRPVVEECGPDARECIDNGGDRESCAPAFQECVRGYIVENFDELCDEATARCENASEEDRGADQREAHCEHITQRCEDGLPEDFGNRPLGEERE